MSSGGQNNWTNGGRGGRWGRGGGYAGGRTGRGTLRSRGTGGGYAGRGRGAPSQQFDLRNAPTQPESMRAPQQQRTTAIPSAPRGGAAGRGRGHEHERIHGSSEENISLRRELSSAKTEAAKWQSLYEQTNSRLQAFEAVYHKLRNRTVSTIDEASREFGEQSLQLMDLDLEDEQIDLDAERAENAEYDEILAEENIIAQLYEKKKQRAEMEARWREEAEARRRERKHKKWADRKAEQGLDDEIDWGDDNPSDVSTDVSDDDMMGLGDDENKEEKPESA